MLPELKKDEAKKELEGVLNDAKAKDQKAREAAMSTAERQKFEADKKDAEAKRIEVEAKAKKDAELLLKKDEEITDEAEKKRKAELLAKQRKDEEDKLSTEDKIKRVKDESQKRIDEIVNQIKEIKDTTSKEAQALRQELEIERKAKVDLEKKISVPPKDDVVALVKKEENERRTKYLQEDASKPREERREMGKDELDDWMLEDQSEAVAWINRREIRRAVEMHQNISSKQLENRTKTLVEKQIQSFSRVLIKHPELDVKKRKDELKAQGKTGQEIESTLQGENPKYKLSLEIAEKHPEWRTEEDAPELLIAELEKQLGKQPDNKGSEEIEALKKQVETLSAKLEELTNPPDEGITSTLQRDRVRKEAASEGEKILIQTMREAKAPQSAIDNAVTKYRARQKG